MNKDPTSTANTEIPTPSEQTPCNEDVTFSLTLNFIIPESGSQLSTPIINDEEELLSIPREIISTSISASKLQTELLRPLIAGTYNGLPAYLLKLQCQFNYSGGGRTWLSRIQVATINVVLEDAPSSTEGGAKQSDIRGGSGSVKHPSIVGVYPGARGWKGPISSVPVAVETSTAYQAGIKGSGIPGIEPSLGVSRSRNETRSINDTGSATVTTMTLGGTGSQRNILSITVAENPVDALGILPFMVLPLIVTHHQRRFKMRVTVNATFGFWRGMLAERVPVLGRSDEPLFFDPMVLEKMMVAGATRGAGVKVVEQGGELEEVDLEEHTSLVDED